MAEQVCAETVLVIVKDAGKGSGTVFKRDGKVFVLTAWHVAMKHSPTNPITIEQVTQVAGKIAASVSFSAWPIVLDEKADLAILATDAPDVFASYVSFSNVQRLPIGTEVVHVGNLYGYAYRESYSRGVVAALGSEKHPGNEGFPWACVDQATVLAYPGSSGGGVFDWKTGELVGVLVGVGSSGYATLPGISLFVPMEEINWALVRHNATWVVCPQ